MSEELNLNEMLKIRRDKLNTLMEKGKNPYLVEKYEFTHHSKDIQDNFEELQGESVKVAGRIMSRRGHGKVNFMDLQDAEGTIQLFVSKDNLGEEEFEDLNLLDIGDIVGAEGEVFKTQSGEISIRVHELLLMTKTLQILPEKHHGLRDKELRYRQRYVDLLVNPEVKDVFLKRTKIIQAMRKYLDGQDFLEVETPILSTIAGGANARPFETHHNALNVDMYMRIANELYLKRLIVGGFDKVYEIGKMFRNEGMSPRHNPEFTNMELYWAYADYEDIMELTENLIEYIALEVLGTTKVNYGDREIDFKSPWARIDMTDAVKQETGLDFHPIDGDEKARELARTLNNENIEIKDNLSRGEVIEELFEEYCEHLYIQPTFVTGHPVEISPLAKRNPDDPRITNRFEAFANGWEIANAFSELNDPIDQRQRFEDQAAQRDEGDDEAHPMDEDFLNAIEVGLPPTGGLGIGVDRMIILLTGQDSIRDILFFPTMRPLESEDPKEAEIKEIKIDLDLSKVKIDPAFEEMVSFDEFSEMDMRAVKVLKCEEVEKSDKLLKFALDDGTNKERVILSGIKEYYSPNELVGKTLLAITNIPARKMMGVDSEGMLLSTVYQYDGEEGLDLVILSDNVPAGAKLH